MADIFGRNFKYGGGFDGDKTNITISGMSGALVSNLQFSYGLAINRIWDLLTGNVFFVAGRTEGNWSISRVVGPGKGITGLTVCNPGTISISAKSGFCTGSGTGNYSLQNAVLTGISVAVSSDSMIMTEGATGIFATLSTR